MFGCWSRSIVHLRASTEHRQKAEVISPRAPNAPTCHRPGQPTRSAHAWAAASQPEPPFPDSAKNAQTETRGFGYEPAFHCAPNRDRSGGHRLFRRGSLAPHRRRSFRYYRADFAAGKVTTARSSALACSATAFDLQLRLDVRGLGDHQYAYLGVVGLGVALASCAATAKSITGESGS